MGVTERDTRIDSLKGLLILLVILGHIIGTCGTGSLNEDVWQFIYSFHMPLFILISGYFMKLKDEKAKFWRSILPLVAVLLIFQCVYLLVSCVVTKKLFSLLYLVTPYWTLWYLLSLVLWKIILQFSPRSLLERPFLYLALATCVSVFCGLLPPFGRILSIQRTLNFFPFFLLGYYFGRGMIKSRLWSNYMSYLLVLVCIILIISNLPPPIDAFNSIDSAKVLLRGADHYSITDVPLKIVFLLISVLLSISVFNIMRNVKLLSQIGRDSLLYYLYHGLIIKYMLIYFVRHFNLPTTFMYILFYLLVVTGVVYLIGRIKPLRWLTNPLSLKK